MQTLHLDDSQWTLLRSFMISSNSAIIVTAGAAEDYRVVFANPAFERLTGYDTEEIIGRNCRFLQNDDRQQVERALIRDALQAEESGVYILRNYKKNGDCFWNRITIFPLLTSDGATYFVSIQQNVSAERATVDALRNKSRERSRLIQELRLKKSRLERLSVDLINAQEAERQAIARELHDELGQRLSALIMLLHRVKAHDTNAPRNSLWEQMEMEISLLMRLARNMATSLRPSGLEVLGLEQSIRELLRRQLSGKAAWSFNFFYTGPPLPSVVEISVFRIIQESLTNILRYSNAKYVVVQIREKRKSKDLQVLVRDDGNGFDCSNWYEEHSKAGKFGLVGMSERVQLLSGVFHLESDPGRGTRIEAVIPVKEMG